MKRNCIENLNKWFSRASRKPLVLRGARQVGKSTLVRLFSASIQYTLIEINLEQHKDLNLIFEELDIENIILNLQSVAKQKIGPSTILFLDEIQATPHALAALRYFYELKPEIPVIAAGSLLEFALKDHSFSMPVGRVEYLFIEPMTFLEYLLEIDPYLHDALTQFEIGKPLPQQTHINLIKRQREFMLIGGMPEAIKIFSLSRSFDEVTIVQNSICNTYIDDFSKYAKNKDLADLQTMFRTIPRVIGNKIKYTNLLRDHKSAHVATLLELLVKARLINKIYASDLSGVPLLSGINPKIFKLLFLDVGLLARLLGTDITELTNNYNRNLLNEGSLAEQYIGQHLNLDKTMQTPPEIFYWLREAKNSNAEIDYAIAKGSLIVPIEVKSGMSGSLKSLHQLMCEKEFSWAFRFDMQPASVQEIITKVSTKEGQADSRYTLISLPLYAVELLPKLIDNIRQNV